MSASERPYHHGDLRSALITAALNRRALHRVMSDAARIGDALPATAPGQTEVAQKMREAALETSAPGTSEAAVQMAGIAAWAAIQGLADFAGR